MNDWKNVNSFNFFFSIVYNFSDISLRITAIRETFEELGVLICKHKDQLHDSSLFSNLVYNNFDVAYWQKQVSTVQQELQQMNPIYSLTSHSGFRFTKMHRIFWNYVKS